MAIAVIQRTQGCAGCPNLYLLINDVTTASVDAQ